MRVLYFSQDYTLHDRRFLSAMVEGGFEPYYIRLERGTHILEERPLPEGVEPVEWAGGERTFHVSGIPLLLRDLKRVIRIVQPDLIHAGPIPTAGFLAALTGFHPLVTMSWASDLLVDVDRSVWIKWAARYTLGNSQVMIGDCQTVRQKAVDLGFPDRQIVIFPWGIDIQHFSPLGDQNENDKRTNQTDPQQPRQAFSDLNRYEATNDDAVTPLAHQTDLLIAQSNEYTSAEPANTLNVQQSIRPISYPIRDSHKNELSLQPDSQQTDQSFSIEEAEEHSPESAARKPTLPVSAAYKNSLREQLGWQDAFVLVHTRSWEPVYGVDSMVQGFAQAAQTLLDLRLLLLGDGSLSQTIRCVLAETGAEKKVYFAGQVSNTNLPAFFHAADAYISASRSDGTSISLLEAMACGLPALVSDIPGNREWVTHGENGWLFNVDDTEACSNAIMKAYQNRANFKQMGKLGRILVEGRGDWRVNAKKLFLAYQLAMERAGR